MNFIKRLFSSESNKSDITLLRCAQCGKVYKIGVDAMAVSLEGFSQLSGNAVLLGSSESSVKEDLVKPFDKLPIDTGQRQRTLESWNIIKNSIEKGQKRRWKCYQCNNINRYDFK